MTLLDADAHWMETEAELLARMELSRPRLMPADAWDRTANGRFPLLRPTVEERLDFLRRNRIDLAVCFPTRGLSLAMIREPKVARSAADAYNGLILEKIAGTRQLRAAALACLQTVDATTARVPGYVRDGFAALTVLPHGHGELLGAERFHPLYAACEEAGLAIALHGNSFGAPGTEGYTTFAEVHVVAMPFAAIRQLVSLVLSGTLERFPRLRWFIAETGVGWLPYWIQRMDEEYARRSDELPLSKPPSQVLREAQLYLAASGWEPNLPEVDRALGGGVVWASDYPHWDHSDARSATEIVAHLPPETAERVTRRNAAALYGVAA